MKKLARKMQRDERGNTGLETAIILIEYVVEASVFAFDSVSLDGLGTNVTVTGHRALVVASQSTALVKNTTIDVSGKQGDPVGSGTINGGAGGPGIP